MMSKLNLKIIDLLKNSMRVKELILQLNPEKEDVYIQLILEHKKY